MVMEGKPRLGDFPKQWSFNLVKLNLEQVNGKWIAPKE
jgi:hypothetical protein